MKERQQDLALYIINHKIAKEIKENQIIKYKEFKEKIRKLEEEKKEIYKENESIINKVIKEYANDIKMNVRNNDEKK